MNTLLLELLLIGGLLLLNALFAMSEIAVVTSRRSRLEALARRGSGAAKSALKLAADPTEFLSSVQVGITLIGILAGAFGGAGVARQVQPFIAAVPALERASEEIAFGLVVAAITFASLIVGELVPKRIALGAPERIAMLVAAPMRILARVTAPAVGLLTLTTNLVLRFLRVRGGSDQSVTEEDIRALVKQGRASGSVHAGEAEIVSRALRLGDRSVGAIMTPRPDIDWVDADLPEQELRNRLAEISHRVVPLCSESLDHVLGLLRIRDLLPAALSGEPLLVRERVLQPLFVPESLPLLRLVEQFRSTGADAAIVLDEYGGLAGLVTRTDILDDLAAGLPGVEAAGDEVLVRRDDGSWLVDGGCSLQDLEDRAGISLGEARGGGVHTAAGLVLAALGRIPGVGEVATINGHRFEVVDTDGRRIDRLLVTPSSREGA